jgi:mannose-6-phosphate isomerase-like protein (cupin superfamily)
MYTFHARSIGSKSESNMSQFRSNARFRGSISEWLGRLPTRDGKRFVTAFKHGTLSIEVYAPRGVDPQMPHTRDEIYVVVHGTGFFVNGPERHPMGPGDLLLVPAGTLHRFEGFSDDLAVWVLFYGPERGEKPYADPV